LNLATDLCGVELDGPVLNGSGTYDALAARRAFGEALERDFPFSAFVSKTITGPAREGNPPHRLWETPSGMINSIGLPNPGLESFADDLRAQGVPVIQLDWRPPAGGNERLAALLDALDVTRVTLVGNSQGGAIAINMALNYRSSFRGSS